MQDELAKLKRKRARADFPHLSLEDDEYVKLVLRRTPVVPVLFFSVAIIGPLLLIAAFLLLQSSSQGFLYFGDDAYKVLVIIAIIFFIVTSVVAIVYWRVYHKNVLYVTNKHVIQLVSRSLFAKSTKIIDLTSIEDVSFKQAGMIQSFLKYGTLRISTIGTETTYTFPYCIAPTQEIDIITKAMRERKKDTWNDKN